MRAECTGVMNRCCALVIPLLTYFFIALLKVWKTVSFIFIAVYRMSMLLFVVQSGSKLLA